jgi:acetyl-CoA synthetase
MSSGLKTSPLGCVLPETGKFFPSERASSRAHIKTFRQYEEMYKRSIHDSDAFWMEQAASLNWIRFPTIAGRHTWDSAARHIHHTWFEDGLINISVNCLDRHLAARKNRTAILWQGDQDSEQISLTYEELHNMVCRLANALKARGVQKGDRICLYMPMVPEAVIAMLACARIGAIHVVVFGGFSAESLMHRIQDTQARIVITANVGIRGGKKLFLKETTDAAVAHCPNVEGVIVVRRTADPCPMGHLDSWYHEIIAPQSCCCPPEAMNAEDPLFILHTSGSTGKPKGVVHTQAGYLLHASLSHKYIFNIHDDDVYWCTADIGWITGHSYVVYGPLANGCTILLFEGTPTYPDAGRYWQIIEKFKATVFYTAPTAIRASISKGNYYPEQYDLSSLRVLGSVGEPINPEVWLWYRKIIGQEHCPIMDTWWQTETGGILITPLPGSHTLKPGSASRPFFGVDPVIVHSEGVERSSKEGGALCIRKPWPGIMRTLWNDHDRFIETYFTAYPDHYFSGDSCCVDEEGDYWLLGRMDDIANVSGHRIGTAEVESALVSHSAIAEAAVIAVPDAIKGEKLAAFVILKEQASIDPQLQQALSCHVRRAIGGIAVPGRIFFVPGLPKTRSGKIMRRILRKIATGQIDELGDITTLADYSIVQTLIDLLYE